MVRMMISLDFITVVHLIYKMPVDLKYVVAEIWLQARTGVKVCDSQPALCISYDIII